MPMTLSRDIEAVECLGLGENLKGRNFSFRPHDDENQREVQGPGYGYSYRLGTDLAIIRKGGEVGNVYVIALK